MNSDERLYRTFSIAVSHCESRDDFKDSVRVCFEQTTLADSHIDLHLPALGPSRQLWSWYSGKESNWYEFVRKYHLELEEHPRDIQSLRGLACELTLTLVYVAGDAERNVAVAARHCLEYLECRRRYAAGWMIGGLTYPVRKQIEELGGLWYGKHKVWVMPSSHACKCIRSLLPGDF